MIRTVIVEDSALAQHYFSDLLEKEQDFKIIAVTGDAFEAEKICAGQGVDLVLMDVLTQHNHSGLAAGKRIRKGEEDVNSEADEKGDSLAAETASLRLTSEKTAVKAMAKTPKVVIVTSLVDPDVIEKAKTGAADSLWYKDHGSEELMSVIRRTLVGERVFPDSAPNIALGDMFSGDLTARQIQVLRRYVSGMTYDEIAADLGLSARGVRWYMDEIMQKGGFKNRHEMLSAILQNYFIVTTLMEE